MGASDTAGAPEECAFAYDPTLIDSAKSWFLDSVSQHRPDEVVVEVTEGILGPEQPLVLDGVDLGTACPVRVTAESRRVRIHFRDVLACKLVDESNAATDGALGSAGGHLKKLVGAEFEAHVLATSSIATLRPEPRSTWWLHTEELEILVLSSVDPDVEVLDLRTDVDRPRQTIWAASGAPRSPSSREAFDRLTVPTVSLIAGRVWSYDAEKSGEAVGRELAALVYFRHGYGEPLLPGLVVEELASRGWLLRTWERTGAVDPKREAEPDSPLAVARASGFAMTLYRENPAQGNP